MILHGDVRDLLPAIGPLPASIAPESVDCVVTSPPYFGLRDYGTGTWIDGDPDCTHREPQQFQAPLQITASTKANASCPACGALRVDRQIGLEPIHDCLGWATGAPCGACFVCTLVQVFRGVWRVLKPSGVCWVNLGDSYAANRSYQVPSTLMNGDSTNIAQKGTGRGMKASDLGMKPKDLMGMPWRVALALQADGWYLRQEIIWSKPNPMPESVRDRCTKAHEHLFMLSKQERYYFDFEANQEPVSPNTHARLSQDVQNQIGSTRAHAGGKTNGNMKAVGRKSIPAGWATGTDRKHEELEGRFSEQRKLYPGNGVGFGHGFDKERKPRVKNNASFDDAMAIMPDNRNRRTVWTIPTEACKEAHFATYPRALVQPCIQTTCPPDGLVLDPFLGAGTTAMVAESLGRRWIGCELNPAYAAIAERRIKATQPGLQLAFTGAE